MDNKDKELCLAWKRDLLQYGRRVGHTDRVMRYLMDRVLDESVSDGRVSDE